MCNYKIQKYKTTTSTRIPAMDAFTYIDIEFKYVASFLYFWESIDKFWVFVSNSEKNLY